MIFTICYYFIIFIWLC